MPTVYYLKSRSRKFAFPRGGYPYDEEYYGCFPLRYNALQAQALLRHLNANTGCYYDTVEVVSKVPNGSRCLTWQEWLECHTRSMDCRPYALLDGNATINVEKMEAILRTQDMRALGMKLLEDMEGVDDPVDDPVDKS